MNCDRIKEIILTDYIDGEMKEEQKKFIDRHLSGCADCRNFYETVKTDAKDVFQGAERPELPEAVWQKVKTAIIEKQIKSENPVRRFWESLSDLLVIPRPVVAVATVAVFFCIVLALAGIKITRTGDLSVNMQHMVELFDYSAGGAADDTEENQSGFGTSIEEYFL
ncbi:MAG TPA: zf-HC2 domain-containing protein [Candidatus Omnitrophota bacterium]|nr:zf-HC2 domain-containing protein [Candidatus Omnitrophota bacterium]